MSVEQTGQAATVLAAVEWVLLLLIEPSVALVAAVVVLWVERPRRAVTPR